MSGAGRRGRRGGRRQKRREEHARQQAGQPGIPTSTETNGQSVAGHGAMLEAVVPEPVIEAARDIDVRAPERPHPMSAPEHEHPRPMSARELVARLEAKHAHEAQAESHPHPDAHVESHPHPGAPGESAETTADDAAPIEATIALDARVDLAPTEPRRFGARGGEWLATVAGRGTGGTGRVAQARIEAIRFALAAEPDTVAAEVIVPRLRLDDLYDDELAELLERGLRSKNGNG